MKNKFIIGGGIILTIFLILWGVLISRQLPSSSQIVSFCETHLAANNQALCKVKGRRISVIRTPQLDKSINPNDELVLSVNLPKIIKDGLRNVRTGEKIKETKDGKAALCFIVYPVLMPQAMKRKNNEADYQSFYDNYQWQVFPASILNKEMKQENSICTKLLPLKDIPPVSLALKVPAKKYLYLGYGDTKVYGLKILLVPDQIRTNLTKEVMNKHYSEFIPVYLFKKLISFN